MRLEKLLHRWLALLVIVLLALLSATPALAYVAPCQQVEAWVDPDGYTVHFKAYDPRLGTWVAGSESFYDGIEPVRNLTVQDGIVVYAMGWTWYGAAVYDPGQGWRTSDFVFADGIASIKDGVVVFGRQIEWELCPSSYLLYDPKTGWQSYTNNMSPVRYVKYINNAGVVVYRSMRSSFATISWSFGYTIYDPKLSVWNGMVESGEGSNTEYYDIDCALDDTGTATFNIVEDDGVVIYTRGYKTDSGWYNGPTLPLASFSSDTPLNGSVYFTDMSIGGTSWHYDFGDGTSSSLRSPLHTYSSDGVYIVTQTVTSPHGSSTTSQTIVTTHTIVATAGANGSISPSGTVTVNHGASQAFTITPTANYHVADVLVDGVSVGPVTSYTFNNVIGNHTIAASFALSSRSRPWLLLLLD